MTALDGRVVLVVLGLCAAACHSPDQSRPAISQSEHAALVAQSFGELVAPDVATNRRFGSAIAIDGDTAVIGAGSFNQVSSSPAAYIFRRQAGGVWTFAQELTLDAVGDGAGFGQSVAIEGDTVVVGAANEDVDGVEDRGAAYVFVRGEDGAFSQQAALQATNGGLRHRFGKSVAVYGDRALVGAPRYSDDTNDDGAAYVYLRDSGGTWTEEDTFSVPDSVNGLFAWFGQSVALHQDTALIGAPLWYEGASGAGAAYIFTRSGSNWAVAEKLVPSVNLTSNDEYGASVALDFQGTTGTAVVGCPGRDSSAGLSFVFSGSATNWSEQPGSPLSAPVPASGQRFGGAVAVSGDRAVAVAPNSSGNALWFSRDNGQWSAASAPLLSDLQSFDLLDGGVDLDGPSLLVGTPMRTVDEAEDAGTVFAFRLGSDRADSCTSADQCASGYCADGLCCDSACGGSDPFDCESCSVVALGTVDGTCTALQQGEAADVECRPKQVECDIAESCTFTSRQCPSDEAEPGCELPPDGGPGGDGGVGSGSGADGTYYACRAAPSGGASELLLLGLAVLLVARRRR